MRGGRQRKVPEDGGEARSRVEEEGGIRAFVHGGVGLLRSPFRGAMTLTEHSFFLNTFQSIMIPN